MHIKIICIGKLKKAYWQDAAKTYIQRLKKSYSMTIIELKDGPNHLQPEQRMQVEAQAIQKKASPQDWFVCLDSKGETISSQQLAARLRSWHTTPGRTPCFVLGGAYGLPESLTAKCKMLLSFGPMTLPHELARIVLLEQLYRATTIISNHPYHH
jgi:23S rRNA (pseudouridine1915-N3)-methyltransferase